MAVQGRFEGTMGYVRERWPDYVIGYGGGTLLMLAVLWLGVSREWYALVAFVASGLLVMSYFLFGSLWSAHQLYDNNDVRNTLWELGGLEPTFTLVHLSLGRRRMAVSFSRRLTTGRVVVVDIYNPQQTPNRTLTRARRRVEQPQPDPRLAWRDGSANLLPLPDGSVVAVTVTETIGEFYEHGDRMGLMKEIHRILEPGGRLLLAERMRSTTNILLFGVGGIRLKTPSYWRNLLSDVDLQLRREVDLDGLICCLRADKRLAGQEKQLIFDF